GVMTDGNGLDFMRARRYSPGLGRFTTTDPLRLAGMDANLYRYSANQPMLLADPSGLHWCWYGPGGQNPHVSGGPPRFVGLTLGTSYGFSVGLSAEAGIGATAGVGPGGILGPSINAGLASAGYGAYWSVGLGASYSTSVGAGIGYSSGDTYGYIFGWGP